MFRRAPIGFLIAAILALSACIHNQATSTPTQPASVEQQIYADLFTAQTALEGIKAQAPLFPDITAKVKPQINQAIAAYDTAQQSFAVFEEAKAKNLNTPTTVAQLQAMIAELQQQIASLGSAYAKSSSPTPVKAVQ